VDQGDWVKMSKAMADAGQMALKAAEAKNPEGILAAGEVINMSCDSCHEKYQR
jgi:cytochrome c556